MQPLFRFLNNSENQALLDIAEEREYEPGEIILREDDALTDLYIIIQGAVRLVRRQRDHILKAGRRGPGEIFGEMSFLEGQPSNFDIIAAGPLTVKVLNNRKVAALAGKHPGFAGRFYQSLANLLNQRLRETSTLIRPDDPA